MTARGRAYRDPTGSRAMSRQSLEAVRDALAHLTDHERNVIVLTFGLLDGNPRPDDEVGLLAAIHPMIVPYVRDYALGRLRDPAVSALLRDRLGEAASQRVPEPVREAVMGTVDEQRERVFCDVHGWTTPLRAQDQACAGCPCRLAYFRELGRPRQYCSDACRQAAYRRRRASGDGTGRG